MKYMPLGTFLKEYNKRNVGNQYRPVAVGRYGIRKREEIYSKELASDYSKNKIIYKNTLTVGMGSVQIDIGVLTENEIYSVSPAYHTYEINGINPDYLRYCLECRNSDMFNRYVKRGSRQGKTIDLKRWLSYEIPIVDEEIQQEIVEILDFSKNIIEKRKEQLLEFDNLVKSQFIEMFGIPGTDNNNWGMRQISEIALVNPKKGEDTRLRDEIDVSFVPMPMVGENGEFDGSVTKKYEEVKTGFTYFAEGDVLFAKITPCMENGKGAVAINLKNGVGFGSTEFHVLRPVEGKSDARWLYVLTTLPVFRKEAERKMTGSAGQRRVPSSFISSYKIALPPIELQNKFARFVEQTDKSKFPCLIQEKMLKKLYFSLINAKTIVKKSQKSYNRRKEAVI